MENQEHILATADIRYRKTKFARIVTISFLAIVVLSLILGMVVSSYTYHSDGGTTIYGDSYPAHDNTYIGWFGIRFYEDTQGWKSLGYGLTYWGRTNETYVGNIILVAAIYTVLFSIPAVVAAVFKRECRATSLTITDSQVYGSYNNFFFKRSLKMPIDKIDNMTTISGLMDKFRSGDTLGVCSASGIIKLHFVQNTEEVISAAISCIEEIKAQSKITVNNGITMAANTNSSAAEKMKDLVYMKEQGFITEEEYNKKREEIIEKL